MCVQLRIDAGYCCVVIAKCVTTNVFKNNYQNCCKDGYHSRREKCWVIGQQDVPAYARAERSNCCAKLVESKNPPKNNGAIHRPEELARQFNRWWNCCDKI